MEILNNFNSVIRQRKLRIKMKESSEKLDLSFAVGVFFIAFLVSFVLPPIVYEVKGFQEQGQPNVIRLYKPGVDLIWVQDSAESENYPRLEAYLKKNIKDRADRGIEEARIKKLVKWYD